ncbi:hypothetical protein GF420_14460 [candidate division GN15 bacterium]|jgi:hypothetical protein|nr:hypothetical protein [candidate division GN15 bacterium]
MMKLGYMALVLLILAVTGCGVYTFNPAGKSAIRTIAVERFDNNTDEFGLTDRLTEIVIDAFIADGNIKVVSPDAADALLQATLTSYRRVANEFDENDNVETYKILMDFSVSLIDADDQTEVWSEAMPQEGIYEAGSETEEDGQRRAGERLVQAIINRTTKSW